jgi:hypothetical protein
MKKRFRLFVLAGVAAGLALAATGLAASSPLQSVQRSSSVARGPANYTQLIELAVQQGSYKLGAAANPGFLFFSDPDNDATAKITIFSPNGYTSSLTQAPGTTVGKAFALVRAGALGNAILPLSGPVVVGDPANPTLQAAATQCTGSPTAQEILVLNTSLQGQTIQVPAFLNTVGPYVTQQICLPPPATAQFQAQVILANFTVNGVFTNGATSAPSPGYQWVGDFTPYTGTVPNPAGTVEVRTYVGLPSSLTFKRLKSKPSVVKFGGKLSIQGINPAGIKLDLFYGLKSQPSVNFRNPSTHCWTTTCRLALTGKLKANGTYTATRPKVKKRTFFQTFLEDGWTLNSGCVGPSPTGQPIPCLEEMLSPMISSQIAVKPPKKRRHR